MENQIQTEKDPIVVSNPTIGQWKTSFVTIHQSGFCSLSIGMSNISSIDDLRAIQNLIETTIKAVNE